MIILIKHLGNQHWIEVEYASKFKPISHRPKVFNQLSSVWVIVKHTFPISLRTMCIVIV